MNASEQIAQFEKNNPITYLDYQVTSWGRMFSDKNNKESFKSNYAVINKDENIDAAIKEIEEYYDCKNILPKIFYRPDSLKLDVLRPYLQEYNYAVKKFDLELMILHKNYDIKADKIRKCEIHSVSHVLDRHEYNLAVEQDDGETYGVRILNKQIAAGNNMFFAYDESHRPVSMALAEKYNNTVYISNVYTTPSQRRKGYGLAVVNAIISDFTYLLIYLHTSNPEAASIYRQLGFQGEKLKLWWAVKGSLPEWSR